MILEQTVEYRDTKDSVGVNVESGLVETKRKLLMRAILSQCNLNAQQIIMPSDDTTASDEVDAFDVLAAWPNTIDRVDRSTLAHALGVDDSDLKETLRELEANDLVIRDGLHIYSLTAYGAILADQPEGGRHLSEENHAK